MKNDLYRDLIVIGGNAAGLAAASQARRNDPEMNITVLESGEYISYGSCGLPYYISGEIKNVEDLFAYSRSFFEEKRNLKILISHKVINLNPSKKELIVINNERAGRNSSVDAENTAKPLIFKYDRLVICSGASPVKLDIPGIDSSNIFNFRTVGDIINLKNFINLNEPQRALVIGGGSVSLLAAEALSNIGIKVTIIENSGNIFKDYEDEISGILSGALKFSGINILTSSSVISFNRSSGDKVNSALISLSSGNFSGNKEVDTDFVILAAGIEANTEFIKDSSIDLGLHKAIKVTNKQQTSYPNIYAAGDCSLVRNLVTGKYEFIPTASTAIKTGRIAGSNAAGGDESFKGSLNTKVDKFFGLEIARTGIDNKIASYNGFNAMKITGSYPSHIKAIPGASDITIAITVDIKTHRLLGAQMIGREGVSKRIDVFATAISNEMEVEDIYMLDLSYAPKISTSIDPVNKICGSAVIKLQNVKF